ncbi:MAG TPA: hypothetical protein PK919_01570 [Candidatus Aminicenantes bacterium]|nr:hypothetical protein [Candidatus Aminicenantes bacterium]
MRRFFLASVAAALLFVLFFLGLNLFDAKPAPAAPGGDEAPALEANLEPGNLFFLVWGFAEPPETDPLSPEYRQRVVELFAIRARPSPRLVRSPYGQWLAQLSAAAARHWQGANFLFPQESAAELGGQFAAQRERIGELGLRFAPLLSRFRRLLGAGALSDFTPLNWDCPPRSLQLATFAAKQHSASAVLAALDGRWPEAADALLDELDAGLRLLSGARAIRTNALGRAMVELALRSLAALLNRSECPPGLARRVFARLPERPVAAFGTAAARDFQLRSFQAAVGRSKRERIVDPMLLKDFFRQPASFFALERFVAISGAGVFSAVHALAAFLLQENETTALMRGFWDDVGRLEAIPPWQAGAADRPQLRGVPGSGRHAPLWWLRNPLGKMMARSSVPYTWPVVRHYALRGHETRARYELTRLLAMARLAWERGGGLGVTELKRLLDAAAPDPFSGRPFRYGWGTATLYSLGADARDDGGRERLEMWRDSDVAVAIRFVNRDS